MPWNGRRWWLVPLLLWWGVWCAAVLLVQPELQVDNAEQLSWVRSLQWGYYKHPPLPTWLLWPAASVWGLQGWVTQLWACVATGALLVLVGDLLHRMGGSGWALSGLALVVCIGFHTARLPIYNHNVILALCSALAAWMLWRAVDERQLRWWIGLGFALGLGLLTKYQALTLVGSACGWMVVSGAWRDVQHRLGFLLACAVMVVVVSPHVAWLLQQQYHPWRYAAESALAAQLAWPQRLQQVAAWVVDVVVVRTGPALLGLVLLHRLVSSSAAGGAVPLQAGHTGIAGHSMPSGLSGRSGLIRRPAPDERLRRAQALLMCWALVPFLAVMLAALFGGSMVRPHWGTSMALWAVLWLLCRSGLTGRPALVERWTALGPHRRALGPLLVGVLLVQMLWMATWLWGEWRIRSGAEPARWGAPQVQRWAEGVAVPARVLLHGDIRVVVAPETVAHGLAALLPERPLPLVDGRMEFSPWLPPDLIARCGALYVVYEGAEAGGQPVPLGPEGLRWRVVPPTQPSRCRADLKRGAEGSTERFR